MGQNNKQPTNVFSPLRPDWLTDPDNQCYDKDFWDIILFYVLHSLCDGQSCKGHTLQDTYLWKPNPWRPADYLKKKILYAIWGGDIPNLFMAQNRAGFKGKIFDKNLDADFYKDCYSQRMCYVKVSNGKNNGNEIMSLFYHLRNGFAHGRYGMTPISDNDYMFFLEDGKRNNNEFEVTARIAIKKSSLLAIRNIIMEGPDDEPNYGDEIIESIRNGNETKSMIKKDLNIDDNIWEREILKLKNTGQVVLKKRKYREVNEEAV